MRIGLVCPYNIFKGGGVQECVLAMQKELALRGHEVFIITPTPRHLPAEIPDKILLLGSSTDFKSPFHTTTQVSVSVKPDVLQKTLDAHHFDILHFHEPWVPIVSRQILTKSKAKNIATFHAKLPDTIMSRTIEKVITPYTKSILKYFDTYTAVSDAAADYVKTLTDEKIVVVPNGIDLTRYTPQASAQSQAKILYVGRLEKRKGVKYLLAAYHELVKTRPDVKLIIAGDGPDRQKLEEMTAEYGLSGVEFAGYISEAKKLQLLRSATVFCSPALYGESFGIVLLEAMACGVPTVAGDNPGYRAVLHERADQSLVDPKKTHDFAQKLERQLFDQESRKLWQEWSEDYVKQFSYGRVVDQYEALYRQVAN